MTRRRLADETEWIKEAACGEEPVRTFFLVKDERYKPGRFDRAMEICAECPVLRECDDYATRTKEKWGVWGGKDRGEARYAQRIANAEAKALREAGLPVPGDEAEEDVRLALAGQAASGGTDLRSA